MCSVLKIDHREQALKNIDGLSPSIQWENLPLGDICIQVDGIECLLIERKTVSDLAASIKDGRYKNQKANMINTYGVHKLAYIFEGFANLYTSPLSCSVNGISHEALTSAILNTCIRDRIMCFTTNSPEETYGLIMNIYNRISKTPDKYATQLHASNDPQIVKMKNTTPFDRYIAQLCQIRGVSDKIARAIATMYPSMKMLIERFDDTIPIRVTDASGKSRNISKNIMKEIYDMTKI
jgi:ERCC4-type nuclease